MVIMTSLQVSYPWTAQRLFVVRSPFVVRHKGHADQKVHGRRGYKQGELFDRKQFVDKTKVERDKWKKLGLKEADTGTNEQFNKKLLDLEDAWNEQTGGYVLVDEFIDKTFNYKDNVTGFQTKVNKLEVEDPGDKDVDYGDERITVSGEVFDRDGAKIGQFVRNIEYGIVDHTYFALEAGKGAGFGSKFYKHLEESYLNAGITEVTIHANIDVGGYAWAKMGYDFTDKWERDNMRVKAEEAYFYAYDEIPDQPLYHSWEIAALTGPDGRKIGKETMLGSDWQASKEIYEDSDTWEAGQAYYESKGL